MTKFDHLDKWMMQIFPKSKPWDPSNLENQDNNITDEISKSRLIGIGLLITTILFVTTFCQVVQIMIQTQNPKSLEPILKGETNPFCKYIFAQN